ncbi:hypothetical protein A7M48_22485 [Acinetobacter baumannii]|nr:hypothetical protein A7M48_22485 [Acinetobacter baumannii]
MLAKRNQATTTNTATTGVGTARIDWTRGLGMRREPDRNESVLGTERGEDAIGSGSDLIAMHMQGVPLVFRNRSSSSLIGGSFSFLVLDAI